MSQKTNQKIIHYKCCLKNGKYSSPTVYLSFRCKFNCNNYGKEKIGINNENFIHGKILKDTILSCRKLDIFTKRSIQDLLHGSTTAFDTYGSADQRNAYRQWIDELTNNGSSYPKLYTSGNDRTPAQVTAYNNFLTEYNTYLAAFNNMQNNPYRSQLANLAPLAFINLFKNITTNC